MFKIQNIKTYHYPQDLATSACLAAGFENIGTGYYSSVYGKDGINRIYKVMQIHDYTENDDGYIQFLVALSKQSEENPYLPKIYGVWIIESPYDYPCWLISMEKLSVDENDYYDGKKAMQVESLLYEIEQSKALDMFEKALLVVHNAWKNSKRGIYDLHGGNLMLRGNQVVITDPLI